MDGLDRFSYKFSIPSCTGSDSPSYMYQYLIGGGGVSTTPFTDRHFNLVNAQSTKVSWKLCSLSILKGQPDLDCYRCVGIYLYMCGQYEISSLVSL